MIEGARRGTVMGESKRSPERIESSEKKDDGTVE